MSAFHPIPTELRTSLEVRLVPIGDIARSHSITSSVAASSWRYLKNHHQGPPCLNLVLLRAVPAFGKWNEWPSQMVVVRGFQQSIERL